MNPPLKALTEAEARELIRTGAAGYWEPSLRDSISKTPITHPEATCICLLNAWFLAERADFHIEPCGRVGTDGIDAQCDLVVCTNPWLGVLIKRVVDLTAFHTLLKA